MPASIIMVGMISSCLCRRVLPLGLLLASLCLTSCVRWNLGARVREAGEVRVGADISHPVDGMIYNGRYVFAPVVEYKPRTPLVYTSWEERPADAREQRRSGRTVVAEIAFPEGGSPHFLRALRAMPEGAVPAPCTLNLPATERSFGTMASNREAKKRGIRAFAAPLDYVVDPVLSVVSTPFYWLYACGHNLFTGGKFNKEGLKRYERESSF